MAYLWSLLLLITCYLAWYIYKYTGTSRQKTRKPVDKLFYARVLKERRVYTNDEYECELSRLRVELERINTENATLERQIRSHDKRYALFAPASSDPDDRPMSIGEAANYKQYLQQESYSLFRRASTIESEIRMLVELIRDRMRV